MKPEIGLLIAIAVRMIVIGAVALALAIKVHPAFALILFLLWA